MIRELRRRLLVAASATFRLLPTDLRQRIAPALRRSYHRQIAASMPVAAPRIDPTLPWGVGVFGYLAAESGVGEGARGSVEALQAVSVPTVARNVSIGSFANTQSAPVSANEGRNPFRVNLVHINADQAGMLPELIGAANHADRYTIGFWAWELAEFPDALVPAFDAVHEVWVPSSFVAAALIEKTDKPVRVMGHRVTAKQGVPNRARFGLPEDALVFLAAVDFNSFLERKNVIGAIAAFRSAFADGRHAVHLVIKAHGGVGSFRTARVKLGEAIGGDRRITLLDQVMSRDEVAQLQASIDVFVSLHRAEGFGLPIAECMAQGKVVIATDYSGSRDFVSADCALPVPYRLVEVDDRKYPLGDGQVWAEPDLEAAARLMQLAADDEDLRARLGSAARLRIESAYSATVVGSRMAARLDEIRAGLEAQ